jgi:hypothetical protein
MLTCTDVEPQPQKIRGTLKQLWMPLAASAVVRVPRRQATEAEEVDAPAETQTQ